jgi:hypothetical protein
MRLQPLMLHVEFKSDLEYSKREFGEVIRAILRWARPCLHQRRSVCFVIVTAETPTELVNRLRTALDGNTANYQCHTAPNAAIARHGNIDTLVTQITAAWREIGERRNSHHMRQPQGRGTERRVDDRQRGAIGQMGVEPRGAGKSTKDFDGQ